MTTKTEEYIRVIDGHLEIRQKLGKGAPSSSGKSTIFFSTQGNIEVDGYSLGVNLYKKKGA